MPLSGKAESGKQNAEIPNRSFVEVPPRFRFLLSAFCFHFSPPGFGK